MAEEPRLGPVRVRVRKSRPANDDAPAIAPRLAVEPLPAEPKKRKPNRGSFQAGDGRPRPGRPKGAKNRKKQEEEARERQAVESARAIAAGILSTTTTVSMPTGAKTVSYFHALLLKELELASKGDWRARKTVFDIARWALVERTAEESGDPDFDFSGSDEAILGWFAEELLRREQRKQQRGQGDKQ